MVRRTARRGAITFTTRTCMDTRTYISSYPAPSNGEPVFVRVTRLRQHDFASVRALHSARRAAIHWARHAPLIRRWASRSFEQRRAPRKRHQRGRGPAVIADCAELRVDVADHGGAGRVWAAAYFVVARKLEVAGAGGADRALHRHGGRIGEVILKDGVLDSGGRSAEDGGAGGRRGVVGEGAVEDATVDGKGGDGPGAVAKRGVGIERGIDEVQRRVIALHRAARLRAVVA